jgi:hypothetical protein|tara:strand:- start:364 stop:651 length:288 start_codon:yes stop_codon:yes gene_type:complete
LTQSSVRANFADSLSQYSKHSDGGTEVENGQIKGYSNKKKNDKFAKTKKLPDLVSQKHGFGSDSDENQLPMIKGGQNVAEAYNVNPVQLGKKVQK